jgi:hypothetical protein
LCDRLLGAATNGQSDSGTSGGAQDVWVGWEERCGTEWEAFECLDLKPRAFDRGGRVACEVTAAHEARPEGRVRESLKARLPCRLGDHVLIEAQLATGTNHAIQLRQRSLLVGHGAEHERNNPSIERFCLTGETIGSTTRHRDSDGRSYCGVLGALAQIGLGLDRDDLTDRGRIVLEVRAAASAHLYHSALQAGEQLAAVLAAATPLAHPCDPRIDTGEHRMRDMLGHTRQ